MELVQTITDYKEVPQNTNPKIHDKGHSKMDFEEAFDDSFTLEVYYYQKSQLKFVIYIILLICTGGLLFLFQRWFLRLKILLIYQKCLMPEMTHALVLKTKNNIRIADDKLCDVQEGLHKMPQSQSAKVFIYEMCQFYIDSDSFELFYLKNSFDHLTCEQLACSTPLTDIPKTYGKNIMDIPIKPIPLLLLDEILTPFNIFQFAAIALWSYDDYLEYAMLILFLTLIQIAFALKDLRDSLLKIRNMIRMKDNVVVERNSNVFSISSVELVPGDIFHIRSFSKIPCDAILIDGSCVVNEAILTGESIPINKKALLQTQNLFTIKGNESSILYCGTKCLTSINAKAIVYQTGFQTVKGGLARSIMFSISQTFSFQRDSYRYLFVLFLIGVCFVIATSIVQTDQGYEALDTIINALEIITIIIPPTLPTALGAGVSLAINRLENQGIQCIKQDKVNVAAKVNVIGFDKTGTLTELGLEVLGCRQMKGLGFDKQISINQASGEFMNCLATCHSLSYIDNELQGDPIDLNMFQNTGFSIVDDKIWKNEISLRVIRRFDFVADLQRMTVIVDNSMVYTKGSPEMVGALCVSLPHNYETVLKRYTSKGYRVLACAQRSSAQLDIHKGERGQFEINMTFLGFLIFENKLKKETTPTIALLKEANLKPIMVTGDNPFTAINVAIECGIMNKHKMNYLGQLVENEIKWSLIEDQENNLNEERSCYSVDNLSATTITTLELIQKKETQMTVVGDVFQELQRQFEDPNIKKLIPNIYVYARMKPNNKGDLMTLLKKDKSNFLAFCGDGTNDTCALKAADVGLALSSEDASLAAPFTSNIFNISSMITLIREGRACLVTSVECFKFMTLYSLIQSTAVMQCYFLSSDLTGGQYLYCDLWLIIPLAFTMDLTKAFPTLAKYRPISDLVSVPVILSVLMVALISAFTQVGGIEILKAQSFYQDDETEYDEGEPTYENTVLIILANTQIISAAIAFTQGPPFREHLYKNVAYIVAVIIGIIGHLLVILVPDFVVFTYLGIDLPLPTYFQWTMVGYNLGIAAAIIAFEKIVVHKISQRYSENEVNQS